jgi:hypothetical protein
MRVLKVIILVVLLPLISFASSVSKKDAEQIAVNFYYEKANQYRVLAFADIGITEWYEKTVNGLTVYYVFNINTGGFVIVSGDNSVIPVLGYSFQNSYNPAELPPVFERWMQDYETQVSWAITNNYPVKKNVSDEWTRLLTSNPAGLKNLKSGKSVLPMIKTTWDQGKYYNADCPTGQGGPDGHAWAGCVPTAMAQIMNYYRWPEQGTGAYTYVHPTYGTLSADFGTTDYMWDEMPLKLTKYNDAVAELLFHLGVSVDLDYGAGGSGMFNHKAAWSLKNYFKYSPSCEYIFRDTCTQNWKGIILAHLDKHKPLYYAGWADTSNISGHAFVCDGYQDTTYFHFNWGWSGSYDGYFSIDNLTPGGNDFTLDHELIVNFFPDSSLGYPVSCSGTKTILAQSGTIEDGSGPLNSYGNNFDCQWLIAPADSVNSIVLTFIDFNTQADSDVVIVYDGSSTADPILGTFSGDNVPAQISSTGDQMLVRFLTNADTAMTGWLASYASVIPVYCTGLTDMTTPSGTLSDESGNFQNYHNNSLCRWRIQPVGAGSVTLHFNSFDLASDDYIEVTELPIGTVLAHFTGDSIPSDVTSITGKMLVKFSSNGQNTATGWEAVYTSVSGILENNGLNNLIVFPNPAQNSFTFSMDFQQTQDVIISLKDITGRDVYRQLYNNISGKFTDEIDISNLPSGMFFFSVEGKNIKIITKLAHF